VSDVISSSSSYGNPGMGSCGVGVVSEGGVIGFGDEGGVIGFGDEGGVIGFGVDVRVGVGVVVVMFFIVFGIPHICDSVVLTNLSFGLLGSHNFDFSTGETVVLVGDGEVGGDGDVGEGPKGSTGDRDVCFSSWAWLTLIIPISNTALAAATAATIIANTLPTDMISVFIFIGIRIS
jgi:hypothetical protein